MWDKVTPQDGSAKEAELRGTGFWGTMISSGAFVRRHDRGIDSARDVVRSMLVNEPTRIKLQEELSSGKDLIQTDAGNFINEEILKLKKKHEEELDVLKEEMGSAMVQGMCLQSRIILITDPSLGNKKLQAELQAEHAKVVSQIKEQAEQQYKLTQVKINNLERRWQDAANEAAAEREKRERELRATAAREHELRIIAEREREQAERNFAERRREMERLERASSAREHERQMAALREREEFRQEARERERFGPPQVRGGYGGFSPRPEAGGGLYPVNTVVARRDSAPRHTVGRYTGPTYSETRRKPEKYNGEPYKTIECYSLKIFKISGCRRPFDLVNPKRGEVQCCYCGKNWKLVVVNDRLRAEG